MIQSTKVARRTFQVGDLNIFYREAGPKDAPTLLQCISPDGWI
jgi:hypothetical protein